MTTTIKDILEAARVKLATLDCSDDSGQFKPHETNVPFEKAPIAEANGFEVVAREEKQTSGFGQFMAREYQFMCVVKLGHAPIGIDSKREDNRCEDQELVIDQLEWLDWPAGLMLFVHDKTEVNKQDPNWWITELWFKTVFIGVNRALNTDGDN